VKHQRTKHPTPVLFGERMRRGLHTEEVTHWERRYGSVPARLDFVSYLPKPWRCSWGGARNYAKSQSAAIRLLESMVRRTGRALPWAATVPRSFARAHGR
jgi:hypothetical protein